MNLASLISHRRKGWSVSTVGDAGIIQNNLRFPISEAERAKISGPFPYYGPTGVLAWINEARIDGEYMLIGEDGDHFLKFRDRQMTLLVSGRFNVNNHAHLIRGGEKCITKWLYYYFMHADLTPFLTRQGVGRFKLTKAALSELPVLIPPLSEQRRVTDILSTWDKAIEKIDDLIDSKNRRKQALMQQLLTGKRRIPGFGKPWKKRRFQELLLPEDRYVEFDDEHSYSLVSIRRRSGGVFFRQALNGGDIKTKVMKLVKTGDFLISRMQVVHGGLGMVRPECDGMYASDSYDVLVGKDPNILHMPFLDWMSRLRSFWYIAYISSHGVHIEKMTFKLADFMNEKISIPSSVEEQRAIANILETCDEELSLLRKHRAALDQQKRGLMQRLLTGKIRVKI